MAELTRERMGELLADLCGAFGKPYGASAKRMVDVYYRVLADYPRAAVEWGVAAASREGDRFPRPAKLRELCARSPYERTAGRSLRDEMHTWEANPWAGVTSLDDQRQRCRSAPCPVCDSVLVFSDRGAVIVHADRPHSETRISYSNIGRPEWLTMGPPIMPEKPKRMPVVSIAWAVLKEPKREHSMAPDEGWEEAQQARAAEDAA